MSSQKRLIILPNLRATPVSNNEVVITRKFLDGVLLYQEMWDGELIVLMQESSEKSNNLDNIDVNINNLPFILKIVDFKDINKLVSNFNTNSVVGAGASFEQNHIGYLCKKDNIPCVYGTEYSLKTRKQIIEATVNNPLLRFRRYLWQNNQERKQRQAISIASGVQCNGTPTYEDYRSINSNALLYFDTRISEDLLANEETVEHKFQAYSQQKKLRLLFSGRLIKMKGADHLLKVAQELRKLKVDYKMYICGDGELRSAMENQITEQQLSDYVEMMGILDFKTELVPFVQKEIDLFVCCHRQGDPSCTYLETMSCGVPIVGYDNEAFTGIVNYSGSGWFVEMNQPDLVAQKIAYLNHNRQELKVMSLKALDFAKQHTFEKTFSRRITHLAELL
ncbi:MAG: glycosyltransferase family 4 protein [Crocosphaera sp.]|nr:glycosyltransferase family 4 protein [Crocosphaera sp.]